MSLFKRRSQSELTITQTNATGQTCEPVENSSQLTKNNYNKESIVFDCFRTRADILAGKERRKTSAELVTEAKIQLGEVSTVNGDRRMPQLPSKTSTVGGARVVGTRRPITPREPHRVLYGKVTLPGRPPSAFSLKYLQGESTHLPRTPPLEPLTPKHTELAKSSSPKFTRSPPIEAKFEPLLVAKREIVRKLPALNLAKSTVKESALAEEPGVAELEQDVEEEGEEQKQNSNLITVHKVERRKGALCRRSNDPLAQSSTEKLIELLKEHAGLKDCTDETANHVNAILNELYERISRCEKSFAKAFILGGLYGLVECTSAKVLLSIARVILALRVSGSNLTGACKLIYKVTRNELNDQLFYDNNILELLIDGLGQASPLEDPEACIYGYGAIRFLMMSAGQERMDTSILKDVDVNKNWSEWLELRRKPATAPPASKGDRLQQECMQKLNKQNTLVERLAKHGGVDLMVLHLQILNEAGALQKLTGPPLHSLYQLSAALRAFADVRQTKSSLDLENLRLEEEARLSIQTIPFDLACPHLIRATEVAIGELEVQANLIRTLSVLSEDTDCCDMLSSSAARIGMLMSPFCEIFADTSEKIPSVLCRLGYILGNIMARHDEARIQFYYNDVAMECLINILDRYSQQSFSKCNSLGDSVGDVLVKMVRVVANMSVNPEVGSALCNLRCLGSILLRLLSIFNQVLLHQETMLYELTQVTLGALHNLCFYQDQTNRLAEGLQVEDSLQRHLDELAIKLCALFKFTEDETIKVEVARVLGNLTRNDRARIAFCKNQGISVIIDQLTQKSRKHYDLTACTTGVLVNILGDEQYRPDFLQMGGTTVLSKVLKCTLQEEDWFLATIICQAFWNLLNDQRNHTPTDEELDDICDLLSDYLDEEGIFKERFEVDRQWEDFALVATDLLERIQANYDNKLQADQLEDCARDTLTGPSNEIDDHDDDDFDVFVKLCV